MKKFQLFWLDGKTEVVSGNDIADAFTHAGYGNGALRALDYYKEIISNTPNLDSQVEKWADLSLEIPT